MSFLRQLIERKISSLTGMAVTFGDFKFSPISGAIEVTHLKAAPERFAVPFLSVDRIEAKVAVARALKGEIVVKTMTIERPEVVLSIRADGTSNFEHKRTAPVQAIVPKEGAAGGTWEFDAERIQILNGRFEYRNAASSGATSGAGNTDAWVFAIDGINASITPQGKDLEITLTADTVGRREPTVELGAIKLLGKLIGGGFANILSSALTSRASLGESLVVETTSSMIANKSFDVGIAGAVKAQALFDLLPFPPAFAYSIIGEGAIDLRTRLALNLPRSIRVTQFDFKAADFSIARTYGGRSTARTFPHPPATA